MAKQHLPKGGEKSPPPSLGGVAVFPFLLRGAAFWLGDGRLVG